MVSLKVQEECAPFALKLHCLAHIIDLSAETFESHVLASYAFTVIGDATNVFLWRQAQ
jgi:hypothetical protein